VAARDDVGIPKALCLQKHFSLIFPECQIEARVQLFDESTEEEILSGQPDFVLDCIDNIDTKVLYQIVCNLLLIIVPSYYILHLFFFSLYLSIVRQPICCLFTYTFFIHFC